MLIELGKLGQSIIFDIILFTCVNVIIAIANSSHYEDLILSGFINNRSPNSFSIHLSYFLILIGSQVVLKDIFLSNYEQSFVFGCHHFIDVAHERFVHLERNLTLGEQVIIAHEASSHMANRVAKAVIGDDFKQLFVLVDGSWHVVSR